MTFDTQSTQSAIWYQASPRTWAGQIILKNPAIGGRTVWECDHDHESYESAGACAQAELMRRLDLEFTVPSDKAG